MSEALSMLLYTCVAETNCLRKGITRPLNKGAGVEPTPLPPPSSSSFTRPLHCTALQVETWSGKASPHVSSDSDSVESLAVAFLALQHYLGRPTPTHWAQFCGKVEIFFRGRDSVVLVGFFGQRQEVESSFVY